MSSIANVRRRARQSGPAPAQAWSAFIAEDVADFADGAMVTLLAFPDPTLRWGPCRWQSRDAVTLPQRGDRALVVFDENDELWVVAWSPFS